MAPKKKKHTFGVGEIGVFAYLSSCHPIPPRIRVSTSNYTDSKIGVKFKICALINTTYAPTQSMHCAVICALFWAWAANTHFLFIPFFLSILFKFLLAHILQLNSQSFHILNWFTNHCEQFLCLSFLPFICFE